MFNTELPKFPREDRKPVPQDFPIEKEIEIGDRPTVVFPVPSLASREFNKWLFWAEEYLTKVGSRVKDILNQ